MRRRPIQARQPDRHRGTATGCNWPTARRASSASSPWATNGGPSASSLHEARGNDIADLIRVFDETKVGSGRPHVILAHTTRGVRCLVHRGSRRLAPPDTVGGGTGTGDGGVGQMTAPEKIDLRDAMLESFAKAVDEGIQSGRAGQRFDQYLETGAIHREVSGTRGQRRHCGAVPRRDGGRPVAWRIRGGYRQRRAVSARAFQRADQERHLLFEHQRQAGRAQRWRSPMAHWPAPTMPSTTSRSCEGSATS